jgi:predicted DNA-binding transcriptional regulator AlpA
MPTKPDDEERLLNIGQVLERVPVSVPTLYEYIKDGIFPPPRSASPRAC